LRLTWTSTYHASLMNMPHNSLRSSNHRCYSLPSIRCLSQVPSPCPTYRWHPTLRLTWTSTYHASLMNMPHQQQYVHMRAYARTNVGTSTGGDSGDLARDIMNRNAQVAIPEPPPPRTHQCVLTSLSTIFCQEMINIMPGNQLQSKNEAQG
jgi:hypothetical protein